MTTTQSKPWVGRSLARREDGPLVRGEGQYVSDLQIPGTLAVAFLRSPVARGRITELDTSPALAVEGVVDVVSARDIAGRVKPFHLLQENIPPKLQTSPNASVEVSAFNLAVLAADRVSYVGEPIAAVVATDRYVAEDALEEILLTIDEDEPVVSPRAALEPGAPLVDEECVGNVAARLHAHCGNTVAAMSQAANRMRLQLTIQRQASVAMEGRAVLATHDRSTDEVTLWTSTQVPFAVRSAVARQLDMPDDRIRVIAPHVGGGFGSKVQVYPEEVLLAFLTQRLKRPVRWVEDRQENLTATAHARDQLHDVEVGFTDEGVIEAVRDEFILDAGVGLPYPLSSSYNTIAHFRGMYRIPNLTVDGVCALTNKMANVPYRGSGRPEASFVIERIVYAVAQQLGLNPLDVMRKNLIAGEEMPYPAQIPYRDGEPIVYDGCDMPRLLDIAEGHVRDNPLAHAEDGLRRGIGYATYTEGSGVGPFESGGVRLDSHGHLIVYSGATPHGQGHETMLAQVVADVFNCSPDAVTVRAGDTSLLDYGVGTFASRSAVTAGAAAWTAARRLEAKIREIAAEMLEAAPDDIELRDGHVGVRAVQQPTLTLAEVYRAASPGPGSRSADDPGTSEQFYFVPPTVTWGCGVVTAEVAVNPNTGIVRVERMVAVHDCGRVINPLIVQGQIEGGLVQGLGGGLLEEIVHDERGIPLTTSLMDYLLPTTADLPIIEQEHVETPSKLNPIGVKGVGESGTIAPPAAIANAVADALAPDKGDNTALFHLPITPGRVLAACGRLTEPKEMKTNVEAL